MRALCYHGKQDIRYDTVPDPEIEEPLDPPLSCGHPR